MIGLARKDSDRRSRPKEGLAASKGNKSEAMEEQILEGYKPMPSLFRNVKMCTCKLPQHYIICILKFFHTVIDSEPFQRF